jgi:hypothetical protein
MRNTIQKIMLFLILSFSIKLLGQTVKIENMTYGNPVSNVSSCGNYAAPQNSYNKIN